MHVQDALSLCVNQFSVIVSIMEVLLSLVMGYIWNSGVPSHYQFTVGCLHVICWCMMLTLRLVHSHCIDSLREGQGCLWTAFSQRINITPYFYYNLLL